jgi:hypothetical protein
MAFYSRFETYVMELEGDFRNTLIDITCDENIRMVAALAKCRTVILKLQYTS